MCSCAGPLCEEPLWGVAFELEVRLQQQQQQQGQGGAAEGGEVTAGPADLTGWSSRLDLQEDVYGPFSGQVGTNKRAMQSLP